MSDIDNNYEGLIDVLLLCTRCRQSIKARINTPNWLRVEWVGPEGECLKCYQEANKSVGGSLFHRTVNRLQIDKEYYRCESE